MRFILVFLFLLVSNLYAQNDYGTLIFEDSFERNESSEDKEEPGNGWISNSATRAKGNKQLDLRDGSLYISTHPEADHAAVAKHDFAFQNGTISMKVKFESEKDAINFNIADSSEKSVHAGHLMNVEVRPYRVGLIDLKTGHMKLELRNAKKSNSLTEEQKKLIATKNKKFRNKLELNKWHEVVATINGDEVSCSVNGNFIGSFKSEGFGHPTKKQLRLIVSKSIYVDDLKIWRKN